LELEWFRLPTLIEDSFNPGLTRIEFRAGHRGQRPRPVLHVGPVLQGGHGLRPILEHAARRHPARRRHAGQSQPALPWLGAPLRLGLLARDIGFHLVRLELRNIHQHGDEFPEAHGLCRTLSARGVLHDRRAGGLGQRAGEDYLRVLDATRFKETARIPVTRTAPARRSSRPTAPTATWLELLAGNDRDRREDPRDGRRRRRNRDAARAPNLPCPDATWTPALAKAGSGKTLNQMAGGRAMLKFMIAALVSFRWEPMRGRRTSSA